MKEVISACAINVAIASMYIFGTYKVAQARRDIVTLPAFTFLPYFKIYESTMLSAAKRIDYFRKAFFRESDVYRE